MNIKSVLFLKMFSYSSVDFISIPLKFLFLFFSLSSIKSKIYVGVMNFDIFGLPKTIAFFSLELS